MGGCEFVLGLVMVFEPMAFVYHLLNRLITRRVCCVVMLSCIHREFAKWVWSVRNVALMINCSGFLRIDSNHLKDRNQHSNLFNIRVYLKHKILFHKSASSNYDLVPARQAAEMEGAKLPGVAHLRHALPLLYPPLSLSPPSSPSPPSS
jgi:hypothetical protein